MKKTVYKIHKFAGVTLGILMFLLALSGILITFREELLPVVYPEFRIAKAGTELHPAILLKNAQTVLPGKTVTNFYANGSSDEASLILFKDPTKTLPGILVMNPYTGESIGEMPLWKNVFAVALFFHANFFLGKTGEWLVGILGLILIAFVGSGILIWLPKSHTVLKLQKTFSRGLNPQKLHHQLGLILAIPLLVSGLTGFLTIFDLTYIVTRALNQDAARPEELSLVRTCDFNKDLSALSNLKPEQLQNLISIHLCGKKNAYLRVSYGQKSRHPSDGYSRILIDPDTQQVMQSFDSSKDPASWNYKRLIVYPIHSGEYFGIAGKAVVFLSGIGLMIIFISGLLLTIRRSKRYTIK
jgi:uncharacterized iron-regulated membrane protein